jgi:hypothetical protein
VNPDIARALTLLAADASETPENHDFWTYVIKGFDGSDYLTRTLLPRVGDLRPLIHQIHREDVDPWMHNHPWAIARFLILSGGYTEERRIEPVIPDTAGGLQITCYKPGDVNYLTASTYHRVVEVKPNTVTLGIVGDRIQDWGFLVKGVHVPHAEYFKTKGHFIAKSDSKS